MQLIGGSGVVILLLMLATAVNQSMQKTLNNSGNTQNIIFLSAGSEESIERSEVASGTEQIIDGNLGDLKKVMDQSAISPEVHYNGIISLREGHTAQALIRGVQYQALWVHPQVRLVDGSFPEAGEIMIGRLAYRKLGLKINDLQIGNFIWFNQEKLKISGIFDAKNTVIEGEIWMPLLDLMTFTQRDTLSCVIFSSPNEDAFANAEVFAQTRLDLELIAMREIDYYKKLSSFYSPIRWMIWLSAFLISIGAFMGGLNTLFAAFSSRIKEFGTLQAIGFSRFSLFFSLFQESVATGIISAVFSIIVGVLFIDGLTFPFSIGVFSLHFNNTIVTTGLIGGILLGMLGGIAPAWKCLKPSLPETLRYS